MYITEQEVAEFESTNPTTVAIKLAMYGKKQRADNQFVYGRRPGANFFVPVCSVVTSKTIINVY